MRNNFFLHAPAYVHCGHVQELLHLGKSSMRRCFGHHLWAIDYIIGDFE